MRLWVEDFKFSLARALRVVGVAIGAVAWASVLGSKAQQSADVRALVIILAAIGSVVVLQLFFVGLPPSTRVLASVRSMERDIIATARERAGGDIERLQELIARISALAVVRISRSGNVPSDRRLWLRELARLAARD
jgi:hypothetical protein